MSKIDPFANEPRHAAIEEKENARWRAQRWTAFWRSDWGARVGALWMMLVFYVGAAGFLRLRAVEKVLCLLLAAAFAVYRYLDREHARASDFSGPA